MILRTLLAAVFLMGSMTSLRAETAYAIRDLGPLWAEAQPGGTFAVNLSGEVVGQRSNRPFLYSNGATIDLDVTGYATDINNMHQVVGVSSNQRAFLYEHGAKVDLGDLGHGGDVYANGINDTGQIVGTALNGTSAGFSRAFVYINGIMSNLGAVSGGSSYGFGINNAGDVVGDSDYRAFLYSRGSMTSIGTLGGTMSFARAISDTGQIVGYSDIVGNGLRHAFLYQNGTLMDLTPSSLSETFAYGINRFGQVVGTSSSGSAFLYDSGTAIDLNTLLPANANWQLTNGADINDYGQIAGAGFFNGEYHAFLLSPVPETAASVLLTFGLTLLIVIMRRQRPRAN